MHLTNWLGTPSMCRMDIQTLIRTLGGPTRVAQICGIRVPSIYSWRAVPQDRCAQIEHATSGAVTVEELRPDVHWHRIPDTSWPHPEGRPLVDVSRQAAASQSEAA